MFASGKADSKWSTCSLLSAPQHVRPARCQVLGTKTRRSRDQGDCSDRIVSRMRKPVTADAEPRPGSSKDRGSAQSANPGRERARPRA